MHHKNGLKLCPVIFEIHGSQSGVDSLESSWNKSHGIGESSVGKDGWHICNALPGTDQVKLEYSDIGMLHSSSIDINIVDLVSCGNPNAPLLSSRLLFACCFV